MAGLVVALLVFAATDFIPPASADEGIYEAFYTPPDPLPPGQPGDLIRTEPSRLVIEPSGQLVGHLVRQTHPALRAVYGGAFQHHYPPEHTFALPSGSSHLWIRFSTATAGLPSRDKRPAARPTTPHLGTSVPTTPGVRAVG